MKGKVTETERSFKNWLMQQSAARAGPGKSQKPVTPFRSFIWMARSLDKYTLVKKSTQGRLGHLLLVSQAAGALAEFWMGSEARMGECQHDSGAA